MSHKFHPTRLRDYEVHVPDISTLPTEKIHAAEPIDIMGRVPLSITHKSPVPPERKKKKWIGTTMRVLLTLLMFLWHRLECLSMA